MGCIDFLVIVSKAPTRRKKCTGQSITNMNDNVDHIKEGSMFECNP